MFYISIISDYLKNFLKSKLTYRSDFWIEIFSDLAFNFMNLFFILVVYMHTDALDGWTRAEVIFIYGFFMVPYGLFQGFFNLWNFGDRYVAKGELDRILTRPAHSLVQVILENMDPSSLFGSLVGLAVMAYAWTGIDVSLLWYDPFVFLFLVLGATMIYAGLYTALTAISLYSDSPTGILPLLFNIQNYGRYPISIYNATIRFTLTWILPFAFVGFYPSAYFLDKSNYLAMALLTPVVGASFLAVGLTVWHIGIRRYRGAGS